MYFRACELGLKIIRTLGMIIDFSEWALRCKLYLMSNDAADRSVPVDSQGVVTGYPFCTDIRIYLN